MNKLDLRKELKEFYKASAKKPNMIDVPEGKFLTITGRGAPAGSDYQAALNALYSVAYTLKFKCKFEGKDFTVMTLESLWWWDDPTVRHGQDDLPDDRERGEPLQRVQEDRLAGEHHERLGDL